MLTKIDFVEPQTKCAACTRHLVKGIAHYTDEGAVLGPSCAEKHAKEYGRAATPLPNLTSGIAVPKVSNRAHSARQADRRNPNRRLSEKADWPCVLFEHENLPTLLEEIGLKSPPGFQGLRLYKDAQQSYAKDQQVLEALWAKLCELFDEKGFDPTTYYQGTKLACLVLERRPDHQFSMNVIDLAKKYPDWPTPARLRVLLESFDEAREIAKTRYGSH